MAMVTSTDRDAAFRTWAGKDGVATLQKTSVFPPPTSYHVSTSDQPLHRSHQRAVSSTPAGIVPVPYALKSDHLATYYPPASIQPKKRDPTKYTPLGRTDGWAPHNANAPNSQRAVYDPVSHKTTLYSFDDKGGVSWVEGKGNKMMLDKRQEDLNKGDSGFWNGRRKGVVEFVDRTHAFAVNRNAQYCDTVQANEHAYHTPTGELTKWMDNAFSSKMKVPFYGKAPYEMPGR
mmetsp:Transcript_20360/g.41414  ORF Transcript_20360/g.41414 Transcript_20360/m.41414 type:complete len:232 (-) Transcript_20360:189-884(-)